MHSCNEVRAAMQHLVFDRDNGLSAAATDIFYRSLKCLDLPSVATVYSFVMVIAFCCTLLYSNLL